jgi:cytokinin dehydrogenase
VTCSREMKPDLFYAALGGLGQFGVITRARIILEPAKQMARRIQFIYTDVELFLSDQEMLISSGNSLSGFDFVQGQVLLNEGQITTIQSNTFSDSEIEKIIQLAAEYKGSTYLLEVVAYYNNISVSSVNDVIFYMLFLFFLVSLHKYKIKQSFLSFKIN